MPVLYDYLTWYSDPDYKEAMKGLEIGAEKDKKSRRWNASEKEKERIDAEWGDVIRNAATHMVVKWIGMQEEKPHNPFSWGWRVGENFVTDWFRTQFGDPKRRYPGRAHAHATSNEELAQSSDNPDAATAEEITYQASTHFKDCAKAADPLALLLLDEKIDIRSKTPKRRGSKPRKRARVSKQAP